MVRRRAKAADIATQVCTHIFRGTGHGLSREWRHPREGPPDGTPCLTRMTQLHDRREDHVTLDEVVKINIWG